MAASLTLRVPAGVPLTNAQVDNNFSQLNAFGNTINSNVGVLSNLTTTATGNIVVAINEIKNGNLRQFAATTSAELAAVVSDETGSGALVFAASPNLTGTSANITVGKIIITDETTVNASYYPILSVGTSSGNSANVSSTKLFFNPSTGLLTSTDYNSSSDISLKENFVPISNSLDIIDQLKGFGFNWKDSKEKSYGLSAQDVEKVLPEIVKNRPDGTKGINYMNLTAFLIEAIKDLKQEIQQLKKYK